MLMKAVDVDVDARVGLYERVKGVDVEVDGEGKTHKRTTTIRPSRNEQN
jgi:hypothetical protein